MNLGLLHDIRKQIRSNTYARLISKKVKSSLVRMDGLGATLMFSCIQILGVECRDLFVLSRCGPNLHLDEPNVCQGWAYHLVTTVIKDQRPPYTCFGHDSKHIYRNFELCMLRNLISLDFLFAIFLSYGRFRHM